MKALSPKPLENIRVLDLSRYMAGPFCGKILADLGAEVIKIEPPWGDEMRSMPPLFRSVSPQYVDLNRGKKGLTLNLKMESGIRIFKDLVALSDVVIENFSVGTMDELGIGYETLRTINSRMILASITGFGQHGPLAYRHSFDMIGQAASGLMALNGKEASHAFGAESRPLLLPDALGDSIPGTYAALSILAALNQRNQTGEGDHIDIAQQDALMYLSISLVLYLSTGETFLDSMRKYHIGIYNTFRTRDGYIAIAALGSFVDELADLLGVESANDDAVKEWAKNKNMEEAMRLLSDRDIPASPVLTIDQLPSSSQVKARDMVVRVKVPEVGEINITGIPMKFSKNPLKIERGPPTLGQDNEEILSKMLGYSSSEIEKLKNEGVV